MGDIGAMNELVSTEMSHASVYMSILSVLNTSAAFPDLFGCQRRDGYELLQALRILGHIYGLPNYGGCGGHGECKYPGFFVCSQSIHNV